MRPNINAQERTTISRWLAPLLACTLIAACGGGGSDPAVEPSAQVPEDPLPAIAAAVPLDDNHQVGQLNWPDGTTDTGAKGQPVAGMECGQIPQTFHIHSHLSIFLNGQALAIPAGIGLMRTPTLDCEYNIHTHDHSGKLHIEGPAPASRTLGELFAIWGMPLMRDNVAGITGLPVVAYITENGQVSRWQGELADIVLLSHRHIAIQIGTLLTEVPFFTWSAN